MARAASQTYPSGLQAGPGHAQGPDRSSAPGENAPNNGAENRRETKPTSQLASHPTMSSSGSNSGDVKGDTRPIPGGIAPGASGTVRIPTLAEAQTAVEEISKGGTNMDTLVGRLVVEQGLATKDEVQHALDRAKTDAAEANQKSLAQMLVDQRFVTERQIVRLRQVLEAERSNQKIPGYKVLGKLGAGAMATVFKAQQLSLDRTVAIKILPKKFTSNPQFIERFYAEGRAAAQLNHPNIVQAFDVGKAGEFHYFVMEYVDGRTVFDDIVKHKRYPETEAIDVVIQVAEALQHAHEKDLIHRDVKPKNIMIAKEGVVKLADMGLARAISDKEAAEAEQGKAFGTPYYISPEQIRGDVNIGPAADIYSLGATLYHMVTGNVPFEGKNPSAVMHKHLKAELAPPDHVNPRLSAGISQVIEMMMAKSRGKRYQNCKDLLIDLRAVRDGASPVIAQQDMLAETELAGLAAAEVEAAGEIQEDTSNEGLRSPFAHPGVIVLILVLLVSIVVNLMQFTS
ncbi:MAG: serine/threonine-protein kinase [Planctomycetota bacterium]